jgi:transposase
VSLDLQALCPFTLRRGAGMGAGNCSGGLSRDAVQQIRVRGSPVREVAQRLGVRSRFLDKRLRLFAEPSPKVAGIDHEAGNRRLKRELARVAEARDILKRGAPLSAIGPGTMARVLRAGVPGKSAFLRAHRAGFHIRATSGPCAGCCGSTSAAFTHGSRNR